MPHGPPDPFRGLPVHPVAAVRHQLELFEDPQIDTAKKRPLGALGQVYSSSALRPRLRILGSVGATLANLEHEAPYKP